MVRILESNHSTMQPVSRLASEIQPDNLLMINIMWGSLKYANAKVESYLVIISSENFKDTKDPV